MPTEGLLMPPVLLGVLRVFRDFEGRATSDVNLPPRLALVQQEAHSTVDLARSSDRNLIRNSGQYWKGTGLLKPTPGIIELTPLGRKVAEGEITQSEFAAIMIQQTVLPNLVTHNEQERASWEEAGLTIRPLVLILEITDLLRTSSEEDGYMTPHELEKIVIPLAGSKATAQTISEHILEYRSDASILEGWPDCAPDANDSRMVREFLLFLFNFGVLSRSEGTNRFDERYSLGEPLERSDLSATSGSSIFLADDEEQEDIVTEAVHTGLPGFVARRRIATTRLDRSGQSNFSRSVLRAFQGRCVVTGERIPEVLEAAHIIPVRYDGLDEVGNGFCMRVDLHRLYDSGNLRIFPDGTLMKTGAVLASTDYSRLPASVLIPNFINRANLNWRMTYL